MTIETTPATRTIGGDVLPAPGTWRIDPGHAEVAFVGRHFMLTRVRGRFTDVNGEVRIAEDPADSTLSVTIGMPSVSSGSDTRDEHLRSAELFDVQRWPTATYRSTRVTWSGGSEAMVAGELTIRGVTRPVPLTVRFLGHVSDPWGGDRAVFSATGRVNREDFGITWNMALETGGILVSKDVDLDIEVETVRELSGASSR
jgi:polyisoprenoid-binding protein YceI